MKRVTSKVSIKKPNKIKIGTLKLTSCNKTSLQSINDKFTGMIQQKNRLIGPISFPKRTYCVPVRRGPGGNGSGTYDHFRRVQFKRLYEIQEFSAIDTIFEVLTNVKDVSYAIVFD